MSVNFYTPSGKRHDFGCIHGEKCNKSAMAWLAGAHD